MLSSFYERMKNATSRLIRDEDLLEATGAAIALMCVSEGVVEEGAVDEGIRRAKACKAILDLKYTPTEIEKTILRMVDRIEHGGRSGRNECMSELRDIPMKDSTGEMGKIVLLIALDVGDVGGLNDSKQKMARTIASELNVNFDEVSGL